MLVTDGYEMIYLIVFKRIVFIFNFIFKGRNILGSLGLRCCMGLYKVKNGLFLLALVTVMQVFDNDKFVMLRSFVSIFADFDQLFIVDFLTLLAALVQIVVWPYLIWSLEG